MTRREFLKTAARWTATAGLGLLGVHAAGLSDLLSADDREGRRKGYVWQIDPRKCVQCGNCATACVMSLSAVKCVHEYEICGYCRLCSGYFTPEALELTTAAENLLCPTDAIVRSFVEDPYFEYVIDESLCIGCGKCVKGCASFGNGSLFLQIRHDRCLDCNQCAIALACPVEAIRRVPASGSYLLKGEG
jgi:Na+-translocating ferredoxin:NAD+ oxidoreductase subunit B